MGKPCLITYIKKKAFSLRKEESLFPQQQGPNNIVVLSPFEKGVYQIEKKVSSFFVFSESYPEVRPEESQ